MPGQTASSVGGHLVRVVLEVDDRAVVEEAAPLRVEADHGDVVFELAAGLGEDLAQHGGLDQDGRAHVEAEALLR